MNITWKNEKRLTHRSVRRCGEQGAYSVGIHRLVENKNTATPRRMPSGMQPALAEQGCIPTECLILGGDAIFYRAKFPTGKKRTMNVKENIECNVLTNKAKALRLRRRKQSFRRAKDDEHNMEKRQKNYNAIRELLTVKAFTISLLVLLQCFTPVIGQITFDKGYIIDNSGKKIECLIKNYDWMANPKTIQYKLSEGSSAVSVPIDSIREFKVDNYPRFVKIVVKIDRSSTKIGLLSTTSAPLWSEETLLLKELTCGKACLWVYTGTEGKSWFFYSLDGSHPEQLIYKKYNLNEENIIHENAGFRQQLYNYLQNENTKDINLKNMKYEETQLVKYFDRYNSLYEENRQAEVKKPEREIWNMKITGSLNYSWLVANKAMTYKFDFGGKSNWTAGLELEYFLPFNRNTVSVLFAPTFEHYKNRKIFDDFPVSIDMASLHFPIGLRYSLFLNNDTKFIFAGYYNPFIYINSNDGFTYRDLDINDNTKLDISEFDNWILGIGFAYKAWQLELKYHTSRNLLNSYNSWWTDYTKAEMSISYKFFSVRK